MKKNLLIFTIALGLVVSSCGNNAQNKVEATDSQKVAEVEGKDLTVDVNASQIKWVGSKFGGSHNGTIAIKEGKLTLGENNSASGSFVIDMDSIVNLDLEDAESNKMLVGHLKSADFFDVEKFPTSTFTITNIEAVSNDTITHKISGNLKMKDIEKNISFGAKIAQEGDTYRAVSVPFTIDRTQWDVKYGSKSIIGDLKDKAIDDNIQLQIEIVAK